MYAVDALLIVSILASLDWRNLFMSKSRAWIVEEFIPEGVDDLRSARTRSRYSEWNARRKAKHSVHRYRSEFGQGDERTCIYCGQEEPYSEGFPPPEFTCPKAPIRTAHWRIARLDGDRWEDVRRRDRMVLEEAMKVIRQHMGRATTDEFRRGKRNTYRLRNVHTNDIIMGDILRAGLTQPEGGSQEQSMGVSASWVGGVSHSKN